MDVSFDTNFSKIYFKPPPSMCPSSNFTLEFSHTEEAQLIRNITNLVNYAGLQAL